MLEKTPRRGQAAGRGVENSVTRRADDTRPDARNQPRPAPAPPVDLVGLRDRLVGARRRLIERIDADWTDDRRFPDSGWTRMLADVQAAINAVDDVVAEDGP